MNKNMRFIAEAAIIAALYVVLNTIFAGISFSNIQFRIAEALTIMPALTPAAIPGIFIGCLIGNLMGASLGWIDIIFGSLTSLLAAIITRQMAIRLDLSELSDKNYTRQELIRNPKIYLLPLPTIILNALVVGTYLSFLLPSEGALGAAIALNMLTVGLGEVVVTYLLALPLYLSVYSFFKERDGVSYNRK